ncbi:hypothetical protein PALB_8640 [Pseudoalteromonas luteoviolacea B = ATCC 29581]|nr:hypothetical protein PALB_8640 [Pseudoalteromonas luteoviolacea B = ATCC 29581]
MIEIEDEIIALGNAISHIVFDEYPEDSHALMYLTEQNSGITFDFSFKHKRGFTKPMTVNDYRPEINGCISAAHIVTDCFIDHSQFYEFSALEELHLYLEDYNVEAFNTYDVGSMWHVLRDLASQNLKRIVFDISDLPESAKSQIKSLFVNPYNVVDLQLIDTPARTKVKR